MAVFRKIFSVAAVVASLGAGLIFADSAKAELIVCNKSGSTAYVAVGYGVDDNTWRSEGWWRIARGTCETVIPGDLDGYYYLYAGDEDEKYIWEGNNKNHQFCVKPDEDFKLTMVGDNCSGTGTARRTFWELNLNGQKSFTQNLTGN